MYSPKVFHNKKEASDNFVMYPIDLFAKINNTFTYNEQKILLALLGCKGDGTFSPSAQYILNITGIKNKNHYFAARKKLIENGYLEMQEGNIYVNIDKIMQAERK